MILEVKEELKKVCKCCKVEKTLSNYIKHKCSKDKLSYKCKACIAIDNKEATQNKFKKWKEYSSMYGTRHPEHQKSLDYRKKWTIGQKENIREYAVKKKFNISLKEYREKLNVQKNICAICNGESNDEQLHLDHCHETGIVRAFLCRNCNWALGLFKDNPEIIRRAAEYTEFHKKKSSHVI